MKKYKNITSSTLAIDCFTKTIYVSPGEEVLLPSTRDVRHYSRLKSLILVKERKQQSENKKPSYRPRRNKNKRFKKSKEELFIQEEKEENILKENGDN